MSADILGNLDRCGIWKKSGVLHHFRAEEDEDETDDSVNDFILLFVALSIGGKKS